MISAKRIVVFVTRNASAAFQKNNFIVVIVTASVPTGDVPFLEIR